MRPVKHKFRTMEIGESYEMPNPPGWFRASVYNYGADTGKHFSVCQIGNGSFEVRRLDKPPTAEDVSRSKAIGAKLMHARRKTQKQQRGVH